MILYISICRSYLFLLPPHLGGKMAISGTNNKISDKELSVKKSKKINTTLEVVPKCTCKDIRTKLAFDILSRHLRGNLKLKKVIRAGATTSFIVASLEREERILVIVPTNRIAQNTIINDVKKVWQIEKDEELKDKDIVQILSNHKCIHNQIAFEEHPDLEALQFLLVKENCGEKCEYFNDCPNMAIIKNPDAKVIVITADKLAALMLAAGKKKHKKGEVTEDLSISERMLKIIKSVKNILFDEAHWMETLTPVSVDIVQHKISRSNEPVSEPIYLEPLAKYTPILNEFLGIGTNSSLQEQEKENKYASIITMLVAFKQILDDRSYETNITKAVQTILDQVSAKDYYDKHVTEIRANPWRIKTDLVTLCALAIEMITKEEHVLKYNLSNISDINIWFAIATIVTSDLLKINAIRSNENITVNISVANRMKLEMIRDFIRSVQYDDNKGDRQKNRDKLIILTTATFGEYDYKNLFLKGTKLDREMFGKEGDPLKTNEHVLVLPDTKTYSIDRGDYSARSRIYEIAYQIAQVINEVGECLVIAPNKEQADFLDKKLLELGYRDVRPKKTKKQREERKIEYIEKHHISYYGSDELIGVTSKYRCAVAIGGAPIPNNAFDVITRDKKPSNILNITASHQRAAQAVMRVKDPSAKSPSVIFMIGVTERECNNIFTYGYDRFVSIGEYVKGQQKPVSVEVSEAVTMPNICLCDDFGSRLQVAKRHMQDKSKSTPGSIINSTHDFEPQESIPGTGPAKIGQNLFQQNISRFSIIGQPIPKNLLQSQLHTNINNYILGSRDGILMSKNAFLNLICNVGTSFRGVLTEQAPNNDSYIPNSIPPLSESRVKWHAVGKKSIKVPLVSKDGNSSFVQFSNIKIVGDRDRLCNYLTSTRVPHIIELNAKTQSYNIWVLIEPIKAKDARMFAERILAEAERIEVKKDDETKDVKVRESIKIQCDVLPKYTNVKGAKFKEYNEIKLMLHPHSYLLIDGEFVNDFEEIIIGMVEVDVPWLNSTKNMTSKPIKGLNINDPIAIENEVEKRILSGLYDDFYGEDGKVQLALIQERRKARKEKRLEDGG